MSRDHTGCIRGFHQYSRAWYSKYSQTLGARGEVRFSDDIVDHFHFGLYSPDGGTSGEMLMSFEELGSKIAPHLKCYDDGWSALASMMDLIVCMGAVDDENITPDQFREMLLERGFIDLTKEKQE